MAGNAPGLLATDPGPIGAGLRVVVRLGWMAELVADALAALPAESRWSPPTAGLLRSLDALVVATRPDEVTLGEWFTRWDSGPAPLVIDRVALASAGWGPKSRVVPPRFTAPRPGAAQDTLRPLGLTVVPLGGTLLITARREAPDRSRRRAGRVRGPRGVGGRDDRRRRLGL